MRLTTSTTDMSDATNSRRDLLRHLTVGALTVIDSSLGLSDKSFVTRATSAAQSGTEIRAYKLYSGPDNSSHVLKGTINQNDRTEVVAVYFEETPAHSTSDWHNSPESQLVITLSGTLEFTMHNGETFELRPGDVLLSEDKVGSGHKWRLIDDQPWRRAYVVLKPGAKDSFVPNPAA